MEIEKKPITFHKHICFLCHGSYEEARDSGKCEYIRDHTWGKCQECEDNFAVGKAITFL